MCEWCFSEAQYPFLQRENIVRGQFRKDRFQKTGPPVAICSLTHFTAGYISARCIFDSRLLGKSIALAVQSGGLKTGFRLTANTLRETCTRRSASPLHETQEASQCTTARFFKLLGRQRLDRPWSSYRDVILAATMELCILVGEPHPSQRIENLKTTNKESEYETVAAAY